MILVNRRIRAAHFACAAALSCLLALPLFAQAPRTPLVQTAEMSVPFAPSPVTVDGITYLAYELRIANFQRGDLRLLRLKVLPGGTVPLADFDGERLATMIGRTGLSADETDASLIRTRTHAVVYLWLAMPKGSTIPQALTHVAEFEVIRGADVVASVTEGGATPVHSAPPVVLRPPLRGGPWVAIYDPTLVGGHRTSVYATGGAARIPARFAIDWVKPSEGGAYQGGTKQARPDWNGYGADVLAVSDGVVVASMDDLPDNDDLKGRTIAPHALENASGNHITLDLGGGRFAFYEHLMSGSIGPKVGDRVKAGDVIARLGFSGSSSMGPHLHFHVADAPSPLGAEGVPFVFANFTVLGRFSSLDGFFKGERWSAETSPATIRAREMPAPNTVVRFD
jgi:murein DD-endopeptidase